VTDGGGEGRSPGAVAFDLDGVLVDSEPVWREVEEEVAARFGFVYSEELASRLHGRGPSSVGEIVGELLDDPEAGLQAALAMVDGMIERAGRGGVPTMPGATELVDSLRGRVRLAVASNSPRRYVDAILSGTGYAGSFEVVVSGDEVARFKPAPDVYLRVAERLGLSPEEVVAVEDSPVGVESARAAGMTVILLRGLVAMDAPDVKAVDSLAELGPEELLRL
jgi:HAD superfamily hydrolase (TIGR01509 family)